MSGIGNFHGHSTSVPDFKISFLKSGSGEVIYETDSILEMRSYVLAHSFTEPMTWQFNTSDTFYLTSRLVLIHNDVQNGVHKFTMRAANGQTPALDVQQLDNVVFYTDLSNCEFTDLTFRNGMWNGGAQADGCNVRHFGSGDKNNRRTNITYRRCYFERGFCAMRMTDALQDILIEDCRVDGLAYGSMRIGNGAAGDDIINLTMRRFKILNNFDDQVLYVDSNGVGRRSEGHFQIRTTKGLLIDDVEIVPNAFGRNRCFPFSVSGNADVVIRNIKARGYGYGSGGIGLSLEYINGLTLENCSLIPADDGLAKGSLYLNYCENITLVNNTFWHSHTHYGAVNWTRVRKINKLVGNIFKYTTFVEPGILWNTDNGYVPTLAVDLKEEHHNLFMFESSHIGRAYINLSGLTDINETYKYVTNDGFNNGISLSTWRATYGRGEGTVLLDPLNYSNFKFHDTFLKSLANISVGRNMVPQTAITITKDMLGSDRVFPTDVGAIDADGIRSAPMLSAPTVKYEDNINNTFDWDLLPNTGLWEYETTVDGGDTYQDPIKPMQIGDTTKAIATIGVRRRGTYLNRPSATLFNEATYTPSYIIEDMTVTSLFINDGNGVWTNPNGSGTGGNQDVRTNSALVIPANQSFRIWLRSSKAGSTSTYAGGNFGLFTAPTNTINAQPKYGMEALHYGIEAFRWFIDGTQQAEIQEIRTYWGFFRDTNGLCKIQCSSDGTTWTDKVTVGTYMGEFYPGFRFDKYRTLVHPKITRYL